MPCLVRGRRRSTNKLIASGSIIKFDNRDGRLIAGLPNVGVAFNFTGY